jgi:hypothetical protein
MLDPEVFMSNPIVMDMMVPGMLKRLKNPRLQFIFTYCILDGHPQKVAADILGINETNVSRQMRRIRMRLVHYTRGYPIGQEYSVKKEDK